MIQCPECYTDNVTGAVQCRDCKRPLQPTSQICANGHSMDSAWSECKICRAEGRLSPRDPGPAHYPTRMDIFEAPGAGGGPKTAVWESPMPTMIQAPVRSTPERAAPVVPDYVPEVPAARKTQFLSGGFEAAPAAKRVAQKIIAVLVTYTWKPEGQIFPIREGRNRIGQDATQCDISLPHDDTMSGLHSSISFRTKFVITDLDSMSGTYVNDNPVEEQSYPLENYARIRTGSTVWTFVILQPPA